MYSIGRKKVLIQYPCSNDMEFEFTLNYKEEV